MFIGRKRKDSVYPTLSQCAKHLLECADIHENGKFYHYMASIVFSAFAMEAFINHLGLNFFSNWDKKEQKLSQSKRRDKIYNHLKLRPDKTNRPYSTIDEIFLFRDSLAHAKKIELSDPSNNPLNDLKVDWEKYCSKENAEKAKKDILLVMEKLYEASGFGEFPLAPIGDEIVGSSLI